MALSFHPYTNFLYDPSRQGYDSSVWKTIFGTPGVSSDVLILQQAATIHLGDCMKGDFAFIMNIANSPVGGESRRFGLYSPNLSAYAWFSIEGEQLLGQISDGTNSSEVAITWESAWSGANTEFKIHWDVGMVRFYIGGALKGTLSSNAIPKTPLAIYLSNANSDLMTIAAVNAVGVHTFMMHTDQGDATFLGGNPNIVQVISIAEGLEFDPTWLPALFSDSVTITENITRDFTILPPLQSDAISIAENVALTDIMEVGTADGVDSISIAENVASAWTLGSGNSDAVAIGESLAIVAT